MLEISEIIAEASAKDLQQSQLGAFPSLLRLLLPPHHRRHDSSQASRHSSYGYVSLDFICRITPSSLSTKAIAVITLLQCSAGTRLHDIQTIGLEIGIENRGFLKLILEMGESKGGEDTLTQHHQQQVVVQHPSGAVTWIH